MSKFDNFVSGLCEQFGPFQSKDEMRNFVDAHKGTPDTSNVAWCIGQVYFADTPEEAEQLVAQHNAAGFKSPTEAVEFAETSVRFPNVVVADPENPGKLKYFMAPKWETK